MITTRGDSRANKPGLLLAPRYGDFLTDSKSLVVDTSRGNWSLVVSLRIVLQQRQISHFEMHGKDVKSQL